MAESGLSIGFPDLQAEVGFFLGYGRADWSVSQEAEIDSVIQSGVRLVYYPPAVELLVRAGLVGYEWSWLRPTKTLPIYAAYGTGTVTVVAGVVTLADGTFPAWAADGELTVDGTAYSVDTRDSDTQVTLDDVSVDADAESSYSLGQADYDLPDDFGRLIGSIHFPVDTYRTSISVISVGQLLAFRAGGGSTDEPHRAATRYKSSTGAAGQRQEILFYPTPMTNRTLYYEYEAYSGAVDDTYPYPLGGMQLAELYIESCLAVAEKRIEDVSGVHNQQYERLLVDAIARDKKRGARNFGQMGDADTVRGEEWQRGSAVHDGAYPITYKGAYI